jgi:cytochrome d ubiquinol oxidase subunit II
MPPETIVAGAVLLAVMAYAVLGGADFGGGIWDLFATEPRRREQRAAIAHGMGPVWEANHVWLIFVIVLLFTAYPRAFQALSIALYVPFHLVLLGIILRGASFVFRSYATTGAHALGRVFGVLFGVASVITPVLLGMCLGAVSSGMLHVADPAGMTASRAWLSLLSWAMGTLALALCAYLAAVYLANETSGALQEDFRTRALIAGTFVVAISALLLPLLRTEAPHLLAGLLGVRALPALIIGAIAALGAGAALRARRYRLARTAAVLQILCLLGGWGLAQFPYIIYPDITIRDAAPAATLRFVLLTLPIGLALILPSLWFLFRVFKREHLGLVDN